MPPVYEIPQTKQASQPKEIIHWKDVIIYQKKRILGKNLSQFSPIPLCHKIILFDAISLKERRSLWHRLKKKLEIFNHTLKNKVLMA